MAKIRRTSTICGNKTFFNSRRALLFRNNPSAKSMAVFEFCDDLHRSFLSSTARNILRYPGSGASGWSQRRLQSRWLWELSPCSR